ncbi:hypothetical protein E2C01_056019 [Portunus trituberculatus]|uniref:Uncharacterized protein n=1 Tax=Portunus trituberculatus TaxID=210409 RepID=A0A5B7GWA2_PORTR|nr:hypothetical protein [Portunus trituberculatus]
MTITTLPPPAKTTTSPSLKFYIRILLSLPSVVCLYNLISIHLHR